VQIVRAKENGEIFALKTMKKEVSLAKNQVSADACSECANAARTLQRP